MDKDFDLASLRAFRAVVREGSFTAAARVLRTPKSTISKRVADLEAGLGVRLIERTTRNQRITAEGEVLVQRAERLLGEADDIRRQLGEAGSAPRGLLRIAIPSTIGQMLMGELGAKFHRLYPEIKLDCTFLDRAPDLLEEGFDGAIRLGPLEDNGQVARLLVEIRAIIVAAPDLPGLDAVRRPENLAALPMIGLSPGWGGALSLFSETGEKVQVLVDPVLKLGSFLAMRDAVIAGAGIAPMPMMVARQALEAGTLIDVLPGWTGPLKQFYFVYPSPQSVTARLRVFIDFMLEELTARCMVAQARAKAAE